MATNRPERSKLLALSGHWLLGNLSREEFARLNRHVRIQHYRANSIIFRKGDPGLGLMAVLTGRVKIASTAPDGKEVVLNIIDSGEVFGEIALLDGKPRTADATTMAATELLALDRRDFIPFLQHRPEVCLRIIGVLCDRLRKTSEQVEDMLFLAQPARLAKTIARLAREYGVETDRGVRIDLKLSQRELGTLVGMRREALNRQLGLWRESGLIDTRSGHLLIHDMTTFELLAEDLSQSERD